MVLRVPLTMVQKVGMGLRCEIVLRKFGWYNLVVVVGVKKCWVQGLGLDVLNL